MKRPKPKPKPEVRPFTEEEFDAFVKDSTAYDRIAARGKQLVDTIIKCGEGKIPASKLTDMAFVAVATRGLKAEGVPLGLVLEFIASAVSAAYADDGASYDSSMKQLSVMRLKNLAALRDALFGQGPDKDTMVVPTPPHALGIPLVAFVYEHPPGKANAALTYQPEVRKPGAGGDALAFSACVEKLSEAVSAAEVATRSTMAGRES